MGRRLLLLLRLCLEVATVSDFYLTAVAVVEELDLYFVAVERPGIVDPVH